MRKAEWKAQQRARKHAAKREARFRAGFQQLLDITARQADAAASRGQVLMTTGLRPRPSVAVIGDSRVILGEKRPRDGGR